LEEAISFSFDIYYSLAKAKLDERSKYLAAFFYRNVVYLSAGYRMARQGLLDPAGNNMRTIFETIVWQYAYLTDDEVYSNFKEMDDLESLKMKLILAESNEKHNREMRGTNVSNDHAPKENVREATNTARSETEKLGSRWSNTKERELENLRRKYNFQKMMKSLYSKEVFERFFYSQYWILSQKSHSSLFGLNYNTPNMEGGSTMEKRPQELEENLSALLYLSAENLLCYLNCFGDLVDSNQKNLVLDFTNKLNKKLPPTPSLAPDTKELKFRVEMKRITPA
jgi:hypothetical protein